MSRGGARVRQQYVADVQPELQESNDADAVVPAQASRTGMPPAVPSGPQLALLPSSRVAHNATVAPEVKAPPPVEDDSDSDDAAAGPVGQVERREMVRGYEFERGRFVLFTPAELKALQEASRDSIDIVAFIPDAAVDPIYYDKAYLVAPDKRGEKTYALLLEALRQSGRSALARWAWKGKEYVVQVRPADGGLVLQQLFYADEVRLPEVLGLALPAVGETELQLALKLIEQGAQDVYDPTQFVDEEKQRILAAVEQKIAGGSVISHHAHEPARPSGQVIDLLDALRASLRPTTAVADRKPPARAGAKGHARPSGAVAQFPAKPKAAAKKKQAR